MAQNDKSSPNGKTTINNNGTTRTTVDMPVRSSFLPKSNNIARLNIGHEPCITPLNRSVRNSTYF